MSLIFSNGLTVKVTAATYSDTDNPSVTVGIQFNPSGTVTVRDSVTTGTYTERYRWLESGTGATAYLYVTGVSGTFSISAGEDTPLVLDTQRAYTVTATDPVTPTKSCTATFQIRDGSGNVLASASITLSAST